MEEVAKLTDSILTIASKIMTFKNDWVTLPEDYQHQVGILKSRVGNYQELVELHDQPVDGTVVKILKNVEGALKKEESRFDGLDKLTNSDQCCSHIKMWYAKLTIVLFPDDIEKILRKAREQIDDILKVLKEESEVATRLAEASKKRANSKLIFDNDSLYVPIENTQSEVVKAIEDPQGCHVVLLHGGVGKGKSTLARYIVQLYGKQSGNCDNGDTENGDTEDKLKRRFFEHVIWVSCANISKDDIDTEISIKQFEILQDHSPNSLGDCPPQEKGSRKPMITKAFRNFLSAKKVLIIFDDVSQAKFLYGMWEATSGSTNVTFLVTSQRWDICSSFMKRSKIIAMAEPTPDEAMNILASLVGLKVIPDKLQAIANELIQATGKNPLALACFASQFAYSANTEDKEDERAWQEAYKELYKLDEAGQKLVLGDAPKSLGAAMKLCIDTLENPDSRNILFMMYECKGECVPEAILRIFHASMKTSRCTFFKSIKELVMRELLKPTINSKNKNQNDGESKFWSLGSLVRYYIEHMVDRTNILSTVGELVGDEESAPESGGQCKQASEAKAKALEKAKVNIGLCALYFNQNHADVYEIVTKAMDRTKIVYCDERFNALIRQAIEPVVWLLDKPEETSWKEAELCYVRKVFLAYVCESQLDGKNISLLLKLEACPAAQLATLKAVRDICYIEEKLLFTENNLNFLQGILHLMDSSVGLPTSTVQKRVQKAAFTTLGAICCKAAEDRSSLIGDAPGVLDVLVSTLASPTQWSAEEAARALVSLSYEPPANRLKIIEKQGALVGLVKCLFEHNKPHLQKAAAGALNNLASIKDDSMKSRIINQDDALDGLVKCLFEHSKPDLQKSAACALGNLASSKLDDSMKSRIIKQDDALDGLVKFLFEHSKPDLQTAAAGALRNLASIKDDSMKSRIINQDNALDGLVKCLSVQDKLEVQEYALASLANLADSTERMRIAKQEGALAGIEKCLAAQGNPAVQLQAGRLLWNLAENVAVNAILKETDGLVKGLSRLLADGIPPPTQWHGARALTLIDPTLGKEASLTSADAYSGRARAFVFMGMYMEALLDLDMAVDLQQPASRATLSSRCFVRAKLEDFEGALDDADEAVKLSDSGKAFGLQERGVLKRIMGIKDNAVDSLEGALADLDEGLKLETEDYEMLKHRGYVKFLLKDEEGARADAEWALRIKPPRVDNPTYGRSSCLGETSVEYLGYKLK